MEAVCFVNNDNKLLLSLEIDGYSEYTLKKSLFKLIEDHSDLKCYYVKYYRDYSVEEALKKKLDNIEKYKQRHKHD